MTIKIDAFELPVGLLWLDEMAWNGVARSMNKSVTGAPIIQTTELTSGRPVTFSSPDRCAWLSREEASDFVALSALDGDRTLMFHDGSKVAVQFLDPPFQIEALWPSDYTRSGSEPPTAADEFVLVAINLITTGEIQPPAGP